jgi:hypothetical protein
MAHLGLMQKNGGSEAAQKYTKLIIGPWNHPGLGKRKMGEIDFGPQAELDLQLMMIRWFDYWLKDQDNGVIEEPSARYFVMGSGKWKNASTWPPEDLNEATYYLQSEKQLGVDASGEGEDTYRYDPADPMPTLWTRDLFTVPADRRLVAHREDVLIYRTPLLEDEVEVVGYPEVVLHASSSAVDTDFFARLVDEYPDGGQALEICYGMVRARHRNGLDREDFLTPGEVVEYRIRLGATACRFLKGHRIRLEITSSDFPNHDRNHNTGKNDLVDVELVAATQTVYHNAEQPSRLILKVDSGSD